MPCLGNFSQLTFGCITVASPSDKAFLGGSVWKGGDAEKAFSCSSFGIATVWCSVEKAEALACGRRELIPFSDAVGRIGQRF